MRFSFKIHPDRLLGSARASIVAGGVALCLFGALVAFVFDSVGSKSQSMVTIDPTDGRANATEDSAGADKSYTRRDPNFPDRGDPLSGVNSTPRLTKSNQATTTKDTVTEAATVEEAALPPVEPASLLIEILGVSQEPLLDVTLVLIREKTQLRAVTGSDGIVVFNDLPPGR